MKRLTGFVKKENFNQLNFNLKFNKENFLYETSSLPNSDRQNLAFYTETKPTTQIISNQKDFSNIVGKPSPLNTSHFSKQHIISQDNYLIENNFSLGTNNNNKLNQEIDENLLASTIEQTDEVKKLFSQIEDATRQIKNLEGRSFGFNSIDVLECDERLKENPENITLGDLL